MEHTPGKWDTKQSGCGTQIYCGKFHIASAHYGNGVDCNEAIENARLIAAAPDLLAAAKWFLIVTRKDEVESARLRLMAAIAKTEG